MKFTPMFERLKEIKADIKSALIEKEQNPNNNFKEYPKLIESIPKYKNKVTYSISTLEPTKGLLLTFNSQSKTESSSYDYIYIYYEQDGQIYEVVSKLGGSIGAKQVWVPAREFYLYWYTDSSNCAYYGFSFDSIVPQDKLDFTAYSESALPKAVDEELTGSNYPESLPHGNYGNKVKKLWKYTYTEGNG